MIIIMIMSMIINMIMHAHHQPPSSAAAVIRIWSLPHRAAAPAEHQCGF